MKDGDFDRLRIPIDAEPDEEDPIEEAQRLGVAATPTRLAAGSAIIAGLILAGLAAVRRRRGSGDPSSTDGAA
jgi:hypothetical protein